MTREWTRLSETFSLTQVQWPKKTFYWLPEGASSAPSLCGEPKCHGSEDQRLLPTWEHQLGTLVSHGPETSKTTLLAMLF